uniref:Putative hemagglutinin, stalk n=1 Tax=Helianthus annuus TaxID=4232 RepID=A0A251RRB2_HELAN
MDTLGDVYYKSYTEESQGDALHQPPWGLKHKDTFLEFAPCRDSLLNSIPPGEVNRQRERTHSALYHAYVVGEANTRAANHQIVREWWTMVREREEWEKYHERLLRHVKNFEKSKAAFDEEKAKFETDKKAEEWGREGLKGKLRAAEELLSKERADWKAICAKDNERMYAARAKITELEGQVTDLKKKVGDAQAAKEQAEAELKAQIFGKDRDLAAKDVEIAELKRRLQEQVEKSESLEIDLEADKSKAATAEEAKQKAEEARAISSSALNVAQNNYAEVQGIVDTLASEAEWLRGRGLVLMANSILNAGELDGTVAALIDASRAVSHRGGYLECAQHAEEIFGQEFDTSHCSVADEANAALTRAEHAYDHLAFPVMDLIMKVLEHDYWCARLKAILDPPEMVEVSDEEEPACDDGEGGDDGGDGDQPE